MLIIKSREAKEVVVAAKLSKKRLQTVQFFCETRLENKNELRNVGHRLGMWVTGYELSTRYGTFSAADLLVKMMTSSSLSEIQDNSSLSGSAFKNLRE